METSATNPTTTSATRYSSGIDDCPMCGGCGWIRYIHEVDRQTMEVVTARRIPPHVTDADALAKYPGTNLACEPCTCQLAMQSQARIDRLTNQPGVAGDALQFSIDDFKAQREAYQAARLLLTGEWRGVIASGPTGTGKTTWARLVYQTFVEDGTRAVWMNFMALQDRLRATYDDGYDGPGVEQIIAPLLSADVLVLDDLGSPTRALQDRKAAVYAEDIIKLLYRVFDTRLAKQLTTIVTTNLGRDDLYAQFGEQVTSRIRGLCHGVTMRGIDYRTGERR